MGYIYRANGTKKLKVHGTIVEKNKSESLRIICYKIKVDIEAESGIESGEEPESNVKSIFLYAFSPIEMEYFKITKPHVDNIVQQLTQMYNNYCANLEEFVDKNGLKECLNIGIITEKQIREHLTKCHKFKKLMDEMLNAHEFFVNNKYLITNNIFYFDTCGILYTSNDNLHPDVTCLALDMKNAKHIKESTFMKNTYNIIKCLKINIFNFVEPTFGYTIK